MSSQRSTGLNRIQDRPSRKALDSQTRSWRSTVATTQSPQVPRTGRAPPDGHHPAQVHGCPPIPRLPSCELSRVRSSCAPVPESGPVTGKECAGPSAPRRLAPHNPLRLARRGRRLKGRRAAARPRAACPHASYTATMSKLCLSLKPTTVRDSSHVPHPNTNVAKCEALNICPR